MDVDRKGEEEGETGEVRGVHQDVNEIVNGVVCGVLGQIVRKIETRFVFERFVFCGVGHQHLPLTSPVGALRPQIERHFIALVSGLGLNRDDTEKLKIQLLFDYLVGAAGQAQECKEVTSRIVRVVLAGNSVCPVKPTTIDDLHVKGSLEPPRKRSAVQDLKLLDEILFRAAQSVPIDVMPGPGDPTNPSLPQQPIHRSLFPKSATLKTVRRTSNPHRFSLDGQSFLGSSGQAVDDVRRCSSWDSSTRILERLLRWNHSAPTAPDTLNCYPLTKDDKLTIDECPRVYFVGNQPRYETDLVTLAGKTVRLVALPSFADTGSFVLLNVATLDTSVVKIDCQI